MNGFIKGLSWAVVLLLPTFMIFGFADLNTFLLGLILVSIIKERENG